MVKPLAAVLCLASLGLVAGCSTQPTYHGPHSAHPAVLKGKVANLLSNIVARDGTVTFTKVDDLRVPPDLLLGGIASSVVRVDPGVHYVAMELHGLSGRPGVGVMEVEAAAGKTYLFEAKKAGDYWQVTMWDDSAGSGRRTLVKQQTMIGHLPVHLELPLVVSGR